MLSTSPSGAVHIDLRSFHIDLRSFHIALRCFHIAYCFVNHSFPMVFLAPDYIAAIIDHLPPKGKQTVRYHGLYSNKTRGQTSLIPDRIIRPPELSSNQQSEINNHQLEINNHQLEINNHQLEIFLIPAHPKQSARSMRSALAMRNARSSSGSCFHDLPYT